MIATPKTKAARSLLTVEMEKLAEIVEFHGQVLYSLATPEHTRNASRELYTAGKARLIEIGKALLPKSR